MDYLQVDHPLSHLTDVGLDRPRDGARRRRLVMDLNRRRFLGGAAAFALISPAAAKDEEAHRFRTSNAEIEMTIEFHDGYASQG